MISADIWRQYDLWDSAIADVVYSADMAGKPAYLDLENEVLRRICDVAAPQATDPAAALTDAILPTLRLDGQASDVFGAHVERLDNWYSRGDLTHPPILSLLAVLSLAAEEMRGEEGMAANNYYGRIQRLLGLTERQLDQFKNGYRHRLPEMTVSEYLWAGLNEWLELFEGSRGVPTAFAHESGHAHIGLPLSQALVRETDRASFVDMFAAYGLTPGQAMPPSEMEPIIEEWASHVPCPLSNSLQRTWKSRPARQRVVDAARQTLDAWDGIARIDPRPGVRSFDSVRLRVNLRRFPSKALELGLVVPSAGTQEEELLYLLDTGGLRWLDLSFRRIGDAWLGLQEVSQLDFASVLATEVRLGGRKGDPLGRRPRRVVPLRGDERLASLVEAERIQLGQKSALLVRDDVHVRVDAFLSSFAREGWTRHDKLPGLPRRWLFYSEVEIHVAVPYEQAKGLHLDLQGIQPSSAAQAGFSGGLKLPGYLAKWAMHHPPEFTVSVDQADSTSARLECVRSTYDPHPSPAEFEFSGQVLIWDLAPLCLPAGDYRLTYSGNGRQLGVLSLRLRSADRPAVYAGVDDSPPGHLTIAPAFGLLGSCDHEGFQVAPHASLPLKSEARSHTVDWHANRRSSQSSTLPARIVVPGTGEHTCMTSGAHLLDVETAMSGMSSVEGVCRYCGLVKRFPTSGRRKRQNRVASNPQPPFDPSTLAGIRETDTEIVPWSVIFDAICHVGRGPSSYLERIAQQADGSALYVDDLVRRLEALGHLNVMRDPMSMRVERWSVTPSTLVGLPRGEFVLCGFRSESLLVALEDAAYALDLEVITQDIVGPPRTMIKGADEDTVRVIAADASETAGREIEVIPKAAYALASNLPALGVAIRGLRTVQMPGASSFERWDTSLARFGECTDASSPGAYRLSGFRRAYVYRRPADIKYGKALVGDARIVKYAAALRNMERLAGYDKEAQVLFTPLGADLPGLYARAAVLTSGRPAMANEDERILQYNGVPPEIGAHICEMLMTEETK